MLGAHAALLPRFEYLVKAGKIQTEFSSILIAVIPERMCSSGVIDCVEEARRGCSALPLAIRRIFKRSALAVRRLLLNALPTRARVHDVGGGVCVFGCSGVADDLVHYDVCPALRGPLFQVFGLPGEPPFDAG